MEETVEVIAGYFVNKVEFTKWIEIFSKNPELAQRLNPELFLKFAMALLNRPVLLVNEILNLPRTLSGVLNTIKNEHEIVQNQTIEFHIKLLKDYIYGCELANGEILSALESVRPLLKKFLKEFEHLHTKLALKSTEVSTESNMENQHADISEIAQQVSDVLKNSKQTNQNKSINRIMQVHLIGLVYDLRMEKKHSSTETYRRLSSFFVNLENIPFDEKSFISALGQGNAKGRPSENINDIKSKIKELLSY